MRRPRARNVNEYKSHLAACDLPCRNDLNGRGDLSEENLAASQILSLCHRNGGVGDDTMLKVCWWRSTPASIRSEPVRPDLC
jgi:hypothetical protein